MVYGYARTARENDGANSIENQTDVLKKTGADVICSEICSGMGTEQSMLAEMIKAMKKGDKLLTVSQDRLTRNTRQFERIIKMLEEKDVELIFIKS